MISLAGSSVAGLQVDASTPGTDTVRTKQQQSHWRDAACAPQASLGLFSVAIYKVFAHLLDESRSPQSLPSSPTPSPDLAAPRRPSVAVLSNTKATGRAAESVNFLVASVWGLGVTQDLTRAQVHSLLCAAS